MQAPIETESTANRIARLEMELDAARRRAATAEEQLRRVHVAVRAFKEKQLEARAAAAAAAKSDAAAHGSGRSWRETDPTLDDRLDLYLQSDFEPDRSRDWMLGGQAA